MSAANPRSPVFFETFHRKPAQTDSTHYCPGCGHGTLQKILADCIEALDVQDQTLLVAPVGCAVFLYYYFRCAAISVPHGRAPAVATGLGRSHPESIVISYQGDGDLAAIGTNNIIHAANRGENMLVLFVNNNTYGMTGGQLAPTTLVGQVTATTPGGRDLRNDGPPLRMAEIIATLGGPVYVERVALNSPANIRKARKAVCKGLEIQKACQGFAFIEVLTTCPTNWRMTPVESMEWIEQQVIPVFPLGVLKDETASRPPQKRSLGEASFDAVIRQVGVQAVDDKPSKPIDLPFGDVRFKGAGFGGQGVLSMGLVLSQAALHAGLETTWLPSYGPEMRGGVANCSVVMSAQPIASPVTDRLNLLIAMNAPSLEKFGPTVVDNGIIVYNKSLIPDVPSGLSATLYGVEATNLAHAAGDVRTANSVALGFLSRVSGVLNRDLLETALRDMFRKPDVLRLNLDALRRGWDEAAAARTVS